MAQPAGLPAVALTLVLARLPVDTRLRCAEVCREWRAAVADPALWTRLDVSFPGSGVKVRHTPALLAALLARAGGRAEHLDLSGCTELAHPLTLDGADDDDAPVLPLLRRHGTHLRTLRITDWLDLFHMPEEGLPQLPCGISLSSAAALRTAAPALLELRLDVAVPDMTQRGAPADTAAALEALARVATPALRVLHLHGLQRFPWRLAPLLGRFDEALRAEGAAALEQLLAALGGVAELRLSGFELLAAPARAAALVRAAAASDRLAALDLSGSGCDRRLPAAEVADFGSACAEVTPRLRSLCLADCALPAHALEPVLAAVGNAPLLTRLSLDGNTLGAPFCQASLLPAVAAAPTLTSLRVSEPGEAARRAEMLAWRRAHGLATSSVPDTPAFGALYSAGDVGIDGHFEPRGTTHVYRCRWTASGDLVAAKRLQVAEKEREGIYADTVLHLALLSKLRHPAVATIRGVRLGNHSKPVMLVRDGALRRLSDVMRTDGPLPMARVLALGAQLCSAVAHCHAAGVLHCDVRPQSALVGPGDALLLTCLDAARVAKRHSAERNSRTTLWYAAPELLLGDVATRPAEDVWALGATLFELYTGQPLASGDDTWSQLLAIGDVCGSAVSSGWAAAAHLPDFRSEQGPAPGRRVRQSMRFARPDLADDDATSEAYIQLVDLCLSYDPALRPSCADVAGNPAFDAYRAVNPPTPPASVAATSAAWGVAPDGAPDSVAARVPLLTAAQLAASPARRDGMAPADEAAHHRHAIALLRRLAADLLHLPPDDSDTDSEADALRAQELQERAAIVASAAVFLLRFYAVHSRALRVANPPLPAAAAALLLACKARERTPALCTTALARSALALQRNAPVPPAGEDEACDADVAQLLTRILDAEWRMAVALCFVFSVDTPCEWLHRAARNGGVSETQLAAALETAARVEEETDAALRFPGATIAACALALSAPSEPMCDEAAVEHACVAIGVRQPAAARVQEALAHVSAAVQRHVAAPEAVLRDALPPPPGVARRVAQADSPHWWPPRPTPRNS